MEGAFLHSLGTDLHECFHALGTDMTHACGVPIGYGPYLTLHPSSLQ